jgi:hypothetical protein
MNAMSLHSRAILRAGVNRVRKLAGAEPLDEKDSLRTAVKQGGQILVIFCLMLTVLIGLVGIAIDSTHAWRESLRIQRAADSAALAGVVYMPGSLPTATTYALNAANRNGFSGGGGTSIAVSPALNPRELDVTITTSVPTFFSRVFGINQISISRTARAVYITPVPMGSPLAYYGVYQLCPVTGACIPQPTTTSTGGPLGVTLTSQGFFGAIEGEGSNRSTGDAFATYYNPKPTVNAQYKADGYRYEIKAASGGTVYLFDPLFCATSTKTGAGSGGHAGAGDHWLADATATNKPSTYFILQDTHNSPLAPSSWTTVAHLYETNQYQVDRSATYGGSNYSDGAEPTSPTDCAANPEHNKWVALGTVSAGHTYSLQVTTTDPSAPAANRNQSFENMFSIAVTGAGSVVHGTGSMVTYANVDAGSQEFYLAQIDQMAGAGKTVEIDLFDPGDVGAGAWLQVMVDGPSGWTFATFSYTADNGRSGINTNCIQTYGGSGSAPAGCGEHATGGGQFYGNAWVSIMVTLPISYGSTGLAHDGWWKIKYTVNSANDTTTWQVSIRGNPVHLIG